jgi:hypothetical protein
MEGESDYWVAVPRILHPLRPNHVCGRPSCAPRAPAHRARQRQHEARGELGWHRRPDLVQPQDPHPPRLSQRRQDALQRRRVLDAGVGRQVPLHHRGVGADEVRHHGRLSVMHATAPRISGQPAPIPTPTHFGPLRRDGAGCALTARGPWIAPRKSSCDSAPSPHTGPIASSTARMSSAATKCAPPRAAAWAATSSGSSSEKTSPSSRWQTPCSQSAIQSTTARWGRSVRPRSAGPVQNG